MIIDEAKTSHGWPKCDRARECGLESLKYINCRNSETKLTQGIGYCIAQLLCNTITNNISQVRFLNWLHLTSIAQQVGQPDWLNIWHICHNTAHFLYTFDTNFWDQQSVYFFAWNNLDVLKSDSQLTKGEFDKLASQKRGGKTS